MKPQRTEKTHYWFPAKRDGWGWGLPSSWQGWVVTATYLALLICGASVINPKVNLNSFIAFVMAINIAMIFICWLKGEPLHGRGR